jgi:hypothetical protein
MPIFECPHCSKRIDAPDDLVGTNDFCPPCGGYICVPSLDAIRERSQMKQTQHTEHTEHTEQKPKIINENWEEAKRCLRIIALIIIPVYFVMAFFTPEFRPSFLQNFRPIHKKIHNMKRQSALRDRQKNEERLALLTSRWKGRTLINVEKITPEPQKTHIGFMPSKKGVKPIVFPSYGSGSKGTLYKVTYETAYGSTRTETIDYDPTYYAQ